MRTLGIVVSQVRERFAAAGFADAAMEARILVGGLLGLTSTEVFVGDDWPVGETELVTIENAVERRLKHEPVHRILGMREFHGMPLRLSRETLEPRPDTELLVDTLLPHVRQMAASKGRVRLLDLGTGTGAILLALLKECPEATGLASDLSEDALKTARANAESLGLADRFEAKRSDWFESISGGFDIIVSNPPYIKREIIPALEPEVRCFDPPLALDGGSDGLDAYRAIAAGAGNALQPHGMIGVEIGFDQKDSVAALFAARGFVLRQAVRDYGNNDRVLVFDRPASGS